MKELLCVENHKETLTHSTPPLHRHTSATTSQSHRQQHHIMRNGKGRASEQQKKKSRRKEKHAATERLQKHVLNLENKLEVIVTKFDCD